MNQVRNAHAAVPKRGDLPDVGALMEFPERVHEIPAEEIPPLIAALERLKAELWACLLSERDKRADRVTASARSDARLDASTRSAPSRASQVSDQQDQTNRSSVRPIANRNLMTVRQFCAAHPAFTEGSVRWLLFNRDTNGLSVALVKKGRRLWIDVDAFFDWLE